MFVHRYKVKQCVNTLHPYNMIYILYYIYYFYTCIDEIFNVLIIVYYCIYPHVNHLVQK